MGQIDANGPQSTLRPLSVSAVIRTAVISAIFMVVAAPSRSIAAEQAEEFVRGLKDRGMNELALDYLERMKTSRLVDEEFRGEIPYHRGVVLIEQSRQSADPALRSRLLDEARAELERFAESNPENVQGADAQLQLGSMQLERGQQIVAQAEKLPREAAYDTQRRSQAEEARTHYAQARETFARAADIYSTELEKLPPTSSSEANSEQGSRRQEYRSRVAQLRFLAAQTHFETARSYPPDDDEFRELHESAAKELAAVFEEFARSTSSIIGLYARLYEGRCYQALGQYPMALGCFEDVLSQPNVLPPFRKLIASALHRKVEVFLAQEKYDQAIENCRACLADAHGHEEKLPEWLAVRYRLAEALEKKAASSSAGSLEQRKLLAEARDAYRFVAASPSEFQAAARTAVDRVARGDGPGSAENDAPRSFQAAYDLGKDALASYNAAKLALPTAQENNPAGVPDLQAQMERGKADARRYFRLATTLLEDDTDPKLVNEVRYFLCWLYWEAEDYYRSAVLGEFLARRYPDHPAARSAAKLSMASFERLYSQAAAKGNDQADTEFEARRMARMAEFIARRWPGTDDADAAFSVLVSYAIRNNRIAEAEKLLAEASPQSRPRLELQLGNAMWGRYLELSSAGGAGKADDPARSALKQSALKYLRAGFEHARSQNEVTDSAATAALYLVQALLSDGEYAGAIELLEDDDVGPLSLVSEGHPAATRPQYQIEAYKAALRAYVLVTPPQEQKAADIMQALDKTIQANGTGGASEQLTRIYIGLGVALEKQLEALRDAGRDAEAQRVSAAFAQFLEKIADDERDIDWPTRVWVAQTYYNMGAGHRSGTSSAPVAPVKGKAREYLLKAKGTFQQLLQAAAADAQFAPSATAVLAARMQLGECQRALGEYNQALDTFSSILKEKESSLAVQRAAAYTYQQRGQSKDAKWLERAIHGGHRLRSTGENRIWGWLKISQVAARAARGDQKYRDMFFEARLNVSRCRYLAAMKTEGTAQQQNLAKAKQSIQSLAQLYPELGGDRWRGEFESLMKEIQKEIQAAAGQNATGLREFSGGATRNS